MFLARPVDAFEIRYKYLSFGITLDSAFSGLFGLPDTLQLRRTLDSLLPLSPCVNRRDTAVQ
ncbi:MAG TPA: hypothetical protein DCQ83_04110 [Fibrobacteres bacterium]|nr:hypothetical protein [Fibrobacterota bacterium]